MSNNNLGFIDSEIIDIQQKLLNMLMVCNSDTKLHKLIRKAFKLIDDVKNECRKEISKETV